MLSGDSSQGEVIGFAQFEGRKFYRQIPEGFSNLGGLGDQKTAVGATLSTVCYRRMGHGMGQQI